MFFIFVWISIIIGCVIMREYRTCFVVNEIERECRLGRIRGQVNFRSEPVSPTSAQKNKQGGQQRSGNETFQRTGDADHMAQIDGDNAGAMN